MERNKNIPQGYKDSPLGIIPQEWEVKRLGDVCANITDGTHDTPIKHSSGIPFITAIHVKDGIIDFSSCYYVDEKTHKEIYRRCNPEVGDVLMVNIGAGVGSSSLVKVDYEFSLKNVALLKCGKFLSGAYLEAWQINNKNKLVNSLLNGGAQPFLGLKDIERIKIILPPLPEQQKIAETLTCWDTAIEKQTQLIEKLEARKRGLMQQLLTGKKRLKGFEGKRETFELGDVLSYQQPTPYLVSSTDYNSKYDIPVLTAGKTFILGYTNENVGVYNNPLPAIIFDDFTTDIKFVNFPFKAKSSAMKILTPKNNANIVFVYAAMSQIRYAIGGHERHWISKYSYLTIQIPSLEEQTAIANILSVAEKEIGKEKEKLAALKSQKKGLIQVLLIGKKRVKI